MTFKQLILSLALINILCGAQQASGPSAQQFSDHTLFSVTTDALKVTQLNVAQEGTIQLFVNKGRATWSPTFRTASTLRLLTDPSVKTALDDFSAAISDVAKDSSKTVVQRNADISALTQGIIPTLTAMGLTIRGFEMVPSKVFNPDVSPKDLKQNPDNYIKQPAFLEEDSASFRDRMIANSQVMFAGNPDFITLQELEIRDGAPSVALNTLLQDAPQQYMPALPKGLLPDALSSCAVTFYDSTKYQVDPTDKTALRLEAYFKLLFDQNDTTKLNVAAFKQRAGETIYVVNMHAGYGQSNVSVNIYIELARLLENTPNLIIAGDFNVERIKEDWFASILQRSDATIKITPEPVEVGNPTWDMIAISRQKPDYLASRLPQLKAQADAAKARATELKQTDPKAPSPHTLLVTGLDK